MRNLRFNAPRTTFARENLKKRIRYWRFGVVFVDVLVIIVSGIIALLIRNGELGRSWAFLLH